MQKTFGSDLPEGRASPAVGATRLDAMRRYAMLMHMHAQLHEGWHPGQVTDFDLYCPQLHHHQLLMIQGAFAAYLTPWKATTRSVQCLLEKTHAHAAS